MYSKFNEACRKLMLDERQYYTILAKLDKVEDSTLIAPAALRYVSVDKNYALVINPQKLAHYTVEEIGCLVMHELLHYIHLHHARWHGRNPVVWNAATDCAVNSMLSGRFSERLLSELVLPSIWNLPEGMVAEWYYSELASHELKSIHHNHLSWYSTSAGEAAAASKLSDELGRQLLPVSNTINWKFKLSKFLKDVVTSTKHYSYKRMSRRYGKPPGKKRQRKPQKLAVAIDTSPSISDDSMAAFLSEVAAIAKCLELDPLIIECDSKINRHYLYKKEIKDPIRNIDSVTKYQPVLDYCSKNADVGALVYFTDGDNYLEHLKKPKCPVIWVYPNKKCIPAVDWGEHIWVS